MHKTTIPLHVLFIEKLDMSMLVLCCADVAPPYYSLDTDFLTAQLLDRSNLESICWLPLMSS
jgi:hypothetical protein